MSDAVPIAIASIIFVALFVAAIWNSPLRVRCERALAQTSSDEWLLERDNALIERCAHVAAITAMRTGTTGADIESAVLALKSDATDRGQK